MTALAWRASPSSAQPVSLAHFRPAPSARGFFAVDSAEVAPAGRIDAVIAVDGGRDLLVIRDPVTGQTVPNGRLVAQRWAMHVAASVGLGRRAELQVALLGALQDGDARGTMRGPGSGLGDLLLTGKLGLGALGGVQLAGAAVIGAPIGAEDEYLGEAGPTLSPRIVATRALPNLTWGAHAGYLIRHATHVGDLAVDDELVAGIAARVEVRRSRVWIQAEATAAIGVSAKGNAAERPVELLAGLRLRVGEGWLVQAAVGGAATRGYGAADLHGVVAVLFAPAQHRRAPVQAAQWTPPPDDDLPPAPAPLPPPPIEPSTPLTIVDDRIVVPDTVLFASDRAELQPDSEAVLAQVIEAWRAHPAWTRLRVEGHTDRRGSAQHNQRLSERRAQVVRAALIRLGAAGDRIETVGLGATQPVTTGTTDVDYARNRRVELIFSGDREP